jgi:hypothetical protein
MHLVFLGAFHGQYNCSYLEMNGIRPLRYSGRTFWMNYPA